MIQLLIEFACLIVFSVLAIQLAQKELAKLEYIVTTSPQATGWWDYYSKLIWIISVGVVALLPVGFIIAFLIHVFYFILK